MCLERAWRLQKDKQLPEIATEMRMFTDSQWQSLCSRIIPLKSPYHYILKYVLYGALKQAWRLQKDKLISFKTTKRRIDTFSMVANLYLSLDSPNTYVLQYVVKRTRGLQKDKRILDANTERGIPTGF